MKTLLILCSAVVVAVSLRAEDPELAKNYKRQFTKPDATLTVETQSAAVLAIASGVLDRLQTLEQIPRTAPVAQRLIDRIARNGFRTATGFLGTKHLPPVLTETGHHDLALRLFQSRTFPSWGYEVESGACHFQSKR